MKCFHMYGLMPPYPPETIRGGTAFRSLEGYVREYEFVSISGWKTRRFLAWKWRLLTYRLGERKKRGNPQDIFWRTLVAWSRPYSSRRVS